MRKIANAFALAAALILSAGCGNAQVPPTNHAVTLSWNVSSGTPNGTATIACTTSGTNVCKYVASRFVVADGSSTCPAVNYATPNYTPLNSASPTTALTYVDGGAGGTSACYVVQVQQLGATSPVSNVVGPLVVPGSPTPVVVNPAVVAVNKQPPMALPKVHSDAGVVLEAKVR